MSLKERAVLLAAEVPALWMALRDSRTPKSAKVFAWLTVAYALSPIDLIPDFIPFFGMLDDLLVLPALVALAVKRIPPELLAECREKSRSLWKDGKPKRWYYALPAVLLWAAVLFLLARAVFS